jgi:hypothetical protein
MNLLLSDMGRMLRERSEEHSASAAERSPLSELRGIPQVDDAATLDGGSIANDDDEAATGDDDGSNQAFRCDYCGKDYKSEKSLKVCTVCSPPL